MKDKKLFRYAGDDGTTRGRPPREIDDRPPEGFNLDQYDDLMGGLTASGWYREITTRLRRQNIGTPEDLKEEWGRRVPKTEMGEPTPQEEFGLTLGPEFEAAFLRRREAAEQAAEHDGILADEIEAGLTPINDPGEMDRIMCRTEPVAEVETTRDLDVARFNARIVLEIDPACVDDILFPRIKKFLKTAREGKRKPTRHISSSFKAWADHRILLLYDFELRGYDLSGERKQLACWLFSEVTDEKARSDKYDRARELLTEAIAAVPTLRQWAKD